MRLLIPLAPIEKTIEMGRRMLEYRTDVTVEGIRRAVSQARGSAE